MFIETSAKTGYNVKQVDQCSVLKTGNVCFTFCSVGGLSCCLGFMFHQMLVLFIARP